MPVRITLLMYLFTHLCLHNYVALLFFEIVNLFIHIGTPYITITPSGWPNILYLSNLEVKCTIRNSSGFLPILETKWQRNKQDFNISDSMYKGSFLDLINPKLVINRIDFDRDDDVHYQCMARNSEGWGSSTYDIRIDVIGSKCLLLHIIQSLVFAL